MALALWLIAAYAIGCLNAGYYAMKLRSGQDIRKVGSGNAGATNVGRFMGKRGFLLVMLFDAVKMFLALKLAACLFPGNAAAAPATMPAVLLGHIFPAQLRFRGGKGIASLGGAGVYFFSLPLFLFTGALFALIYAFRRETYYSGLAAFGPLPLTYPLVSRFEGRPVDGALWAATAVSLALILAVSLREDRTVRDAARRAREGGGSAG